MALKRILCQIICTSREVAILIRYNPPRLLATPVLLQTFQHLRLEVADVLGAKQTHASDDFLLQD